MFRLALRSVRARWGRLVLTGLAIVASTAFLSATFVFRDTIQRTFDALFADVYSRVDAYVQSTNTVEGFFGFERRDRLPDSFVGELRAMPGVADAQPVVQDDAVVIKRDGKPLERPTAPTFGATINRGELSIWKVEQGRAPANGTEVALEHTTAADAGYRLGDTVKVNAAGGSRDFTLVGIVAYDDLISPGNATWALFDDTTASDFVAKPGFVDAVMIRGDGSQSGDALAASIGQQLDPKVAESLTSKQITDQSQSEIERSLGFLTLFLSIFSFIALGVGAFVIYNIFSISAAQRRQEHGLLRAVGASRRQVTWTMLIEALTIGLVGSLAGLAGGIGLAVGIRTILSWFDFLLPSRGLALEPRTVVITIAAGVITSLVAALVPALAAGRVPPVAAMTDTAYERVGSVRRRIIAAVVSAVLGVVAIVEVFAGADKIWLGAGVVAVFIGLILLGPVMAKPIADGLGSIVQRLRGVPGTMARGNVQRNPRRTARTAAPVLIGVALVSGATVFAASIKAQLRDSIGSTFAGEYVINSTNGGSLSFSPGFVDSLNQLPEVGTASGLGFVLVAGADGQRASGAVIDPVTAKGLFDFRFAAGSLDALTPQTVLISASAAARDDLSLGSPFRVRVDGAPRVLTVAGIYEATDFLPARAYDRDTFAGTSTSVTAAVVSLTAAPGVSDSEFRRAVGAAVTAYGIGQLQDREEFIGSRADIVDRSLTFVYGLLALSIVIAVFGIVLTLLLAVYERRRETGLLRAVGMSRSQVRTTVRWESVLTSLYGAIVGVVFGLGLGYVVIVALRDEGLTHFAVPVGNILVIIVLAFVVAVLAAVIPARRATRVDILEAIATT
jgi:putative ABC transport system permease protein